MSAALRSLKDSRKTFVKVLCHVNRHGDVKNDLPFVFVVQSRRTTPADNLQNVPRDLNGCSADEHTINMWLREPQISAALTHCFPRWPDRSKAPIMAKLRAKIPLFSSTLTIKLFSSAVRGNVIFLHFIYAVKLAFRCQHFFHVFEKVLRGSDRHRETNNDATLRSLAAQIWKTYPSDKPHDMARTLNRGAGHIQAVDLVGFRQRRLGIVFRHSDLQSLARAA